VRSIQSSDAQQHREIDMFRFEKTNFGWKAYKKQGNCFVYFGHFKTQKEAKIASFQEFSE
jgi:hypothetical protein